VKKLRKVRILRRLSVALIVAFFLVTIVAAVPADACGNRSRHKPIRGHMDLVFSGEVSGDDDPIPNTLLAWDGEISGGIKGRMLFWNLLLEPAGPNGDWTHFKEIWQIFDLVTTELLIQGEDEGYVSPKGRYSMLGKVTTASDAYEQYMGHRVFMFGKVIWETPLVSGTAPGTFILF
jgi:hypothetical protein